MHSQAKKPFNLPLTIQCAITLAVESEQFERLSTYQEQLTTLRSKIPQMNLDYLEKYIQAVMAKHLPRMEDKVDALRLFRDLTTQSKTSFMVKVQSQLALCELLLDEYKFYEEDIVLQEITKLLQTLQDWGQTNQIIGLVIQSLIIQTRLDIVTGSFESVERKLTQALLLAKDKGFETMVLQIFDLQEEFSKKQIYWQSITKQTSAQERLQQIDFQAYIKALQKIMNININKSD